MNMDLRLAAFLEQRYRASLKDGFPYDDCRKLHQRYSSLAEGFNPNLDAYLSFIAGFSSSATKLTTRSLEEIRKAIPTLKLSFFEMFPQYIPLQSLITSQDFAALYADLRNADEVRRGLLTIMESLATAESDT